MNKGLHKGTQRGLSGGLKKEKDYSFHDIHSVYFDGVNERVDLSATAIVLTNCTVSLWMNQTINNNAVIIGGAAFPFYTPYYDGAKLWFRTTNYFVNWTYILPTNQWVHLVFAKAGVNVSLYIDGVFISTQVMGGNEQPSITCIGAYANGTYNYKGYLSNISLWQSCTFSAEQIFQILRDEKGRPKDLSKYVTSFNPGFCRLWIFRGNDDVVRRNAAGTGGVFFVPRTEGGLTSFVGTGVNMDASNIRDFVPQG